MKTDKKPSPRWTIYLINVALVLLSIFLISQTREFLDPIYQIVLFFFAPLILSLYVFYALRPLKYFFHRWIPSEKICAILSFLFFILLVILLFSLLSSLFYSQIKEIVNRLVNQLNLEEILEFNIEWIEKLLSFVDLKTYSELIQNKIQNFASTIPSNISSIFSGVGNFGSRVLLVLLGIFYLLKDEKQISKKIQDLSKGPYEEELLEMQSNMDKTLRTYISGQMIVATILGVLIFIGYLIIGLPYAFLLAVIALFTNFIPFIGPFLGAAPAVLIALTISFPMVLKVILVSVLMQQIESNLITPNIMGSKLDIHPLTVIIVVLVCMNMLGILGALIATPLYLTIVTIIQTILKIQRKKKIQSI